MILINDIKFACMECIRGHRSSSCKHHDRPLLQVRSKGRPGGYANGNPNHRIAVFAEQIAPTKSNSSLSSSTSNSASSSTVESINSTLNNEIIIEKINEEKSQSKKNCKSQPIIILKSSSKQVIDLSNGEIVGPYDESKTGRNKLEKPQIQQQPLIKDESFITSSGCCIPKINKRNNNNTNGCGCCGNKKKDQSNINKSKILQTYIENKLNDQITSQLPIKQVKFITENPQLENNIKNGDHKQHLQSEKSLINEPIFDVVPVSSCSIPGTCCCDNDCKCTGCIVHGNLKIEPNTQQENFQQQDQSKFIIDQDSKSENLIFNTIQPTHNNNLQYPPNQEDLPKSQFQNSNQYIQDQSPTPICSCPPDSCDCFNCESHGILNGYRLDDFFKNQTNQQLLYNALVSDFNFDDAIFNTQLQNKIPATLPQQHNTQQPILPVNNNNGYNNNPNQQQNSSNNANQYFSENFSGNYKKQYYENHENHHQ
ncbi:hypothetical protein KGF54_005475 [Candida jiufengensis]|uniref:uncharacterized protein n=1 Tax=Candida jiufengensis TaxID=497108 RepID=UPI0022241C6A|nr:uncharacterized protein KGF54_005475 [Candida jiufengensis]KAI5949598.1 hypothetical protein KGF54_005475 [Candida jiufengensis]